MTPKDKELAAAMKGFFADPLGHVMFSYPWTTDGSIQQVELKEPWASKYKSKYGPDVWACEFLEDWGEQIAHRGFDGKHAVDPIRFSTASGHGIGKSTIAAWIIKFIMDTRPLCKGTVTANTADQLKSKTWAELGKWHSRSLTQDWFNYTTGRGAMALRHKIKGSEWFCTAQTCREENSEAFAGQHAANSTSFYLFDEASGIPDKIYEVREGGTTDGEPMIFDFGNPTENSGMFFENMEGTKKHRYTRRSIDSREVALTNKPRIQEWIEDYGEDSDFVKVRVRGMFPSAGSLQFIDSHLVDAAMERELPAFDKGAPLIIGLDIARFGGDESVIYPRLGFDARSFMPERYRRLDTETLVGHVGNMIQRFRDLGYEQYHLFVDETGIGGPVVDRLRGLGYNPYGVNFGNKAINTKAYRYRSDEMWGALKGNLPKLVLPSLKTETGRDLRAQLTQRHFGYVLGGSKVHLETKADMKTRLRKEAASPDIADALALTFAQPISFNMRGFDPMPAMMAQHEYDPFDLINT